MRQRSAIDKNHPNLEILQRLETDQPTECSGRNHSDAVIVQLPEQSETIVTGHVQVLEIGQPAEYGSSDLCDDVIIQGPKYS